MRTGTEAQAQLRGSTYAEVVVTSDGTARAEWLTGMMFGDIEGVGPVRMRISEEKSSIVDIRSLDPSGANFFPARADQTLYWEMEVLDDRGVVTRRLVNIEPMKISAEIRAIPPFGTPFPLTADLVFVDPAKRNEAVVRLLGGSSAGVVDNPGGLTVQARKWEIDLQRGRFSVVWGIRNVSGKPLSIHWFGGALHGAKLDSPQERFYVAIEDELEVTLQGSFDPKNLRGGIVLHATSAPGTAPAEGHAPFYFQNLSQNPG